MDQLKTWCEERELPVGKKVQIVKILEIYNFINGEDIDDSKYSLKQLEDIFKQKSITWGAPGSKTALKILLQLDDRREEILHHEDNTQSCFDDARERIETEEARIIESEIIED